MIERIEDVLIRRDGMTPEEAAETVEEARMELAKRLEDGDTPMDFCEEWFGLEPDYLDQLY